MAPFHQSPGAGRARRYPSDTTDAQWALIDPLLPDPAWLAGKGGRRETHCRRQIVDAIFYVVDNGRPRGTAAGYGAYSAADLERLRGVLAYRRLGFGLREIAELVDDPATDPIGHLRRLHRLLLEQRDRAADMVTAIDRELKAREMGIRTPPEEQWRWDSV